MSATPRFTAISSPHKIENGQSLKISVRLVNPANKAFPGMKASRVWFHVVSGNGIEKIYGPLLTNPQGKASLAFQYYDDSLTQIGMTSFTWWAEFKGSGRNQAASTEFLQKRVLVKNSPVPPVPEDVSEPPESALITSSGLAHRVLRSSNSRRRPTAANTVVIHYTGWTTDGALFDSTKTRGVPLTLFIPHAIPGLVEGIQLMNLGEKQRFWIPSTLAYGSNPAVGPAGMLVFDIELINIISR